MKKKINVIPSDFEVKKSRFELTGNIIMYSIMNGQRVFLCQKE